MPTIEELKQSHDTLIRQQTARKSVTRDIIADSLDGLADKIAEGGGGSGGTINPGTGNTLAYYLNASVLGSLSPITGSRALVSTGAGLPIHHNFTTAAEIGYVNGVTSSIQTQLNSKATPADLAALVDSSPAALNTLNELAAALGNDPDFATTVITSIGLKADAVDVDFHQEVINDQFSSGLMIGGLITLTGANGEFSVSAGYGYRRDRVNPLRKVSWGVLNGVATFEGLNTIAITDTVDGVGLIIIQPVIDPLNQYINLGGIQIAGTFTVGYSSVPNVCLSDFQFKASRFAGAGFGALVTGGLAAAEQATPLMVTVDSGVVLLYLNEFNVPASSVFTKLIITSDFGIIPETATTPNEVTIGFYNNTSLPDGSAVVAMTAGYWKKDYLFTTIEGSLYYIYAQTEYATEPEAREAPVPSLPPEVTNGVAAIISVVTTTTSTSIADGIIDIRPYMPRLFGTGDSASPSSVIALSGDVTGSGAGTVPTTLASVITPGTKGTASKTPTVTVDSKGRTTVLTEQDIQIDKSQVTSLNSDLSGITSKVDFISVTQAVDLDAIETRVNSLDAAVVLRGVWDASAGTFPGSGTAQAGDSWIVSVAGTVNSVVFGIGDRIIAITDNASTSVFVANWFKADYTDQVLSVNGQTGAVTVAPIDNPTFTTRITTPLIKITGGSPGSGKVLTSDADGDATWETSPGGGTVDTVLADGSANAISNNAVFDGLALKPSKTELPLNIKDYGAVSDTRIVTDGSMTSGSPTLTSATAVFTAGDVGKLIQVKNALTGNHPLVTTITAFTNSTTVTLGANATATGGSRTVALGTDNATAIQAALDAAYTAGSHVVRVPSGDYMVGEQSGTGYSIGLNPNNVLIGDGDKSIIRKGTLACYGIQFKDASAEAVVLSQRNYYIKDLQIIGASDGFNSSESAGSGSDGGIFMSRGTPNIVLNRVEITNVTVRECNKEGIAVWQCHNLLLSVNKVYDSQFDAYNPEGIRNLVMVNNRADNVRHGCEFYSSDPSAGGAITSALIQGNEMVNITGFGIKVYSGQSVKVANNILRGNNDLVAVGQGCGVIVMPDVARANGLGTVEIIDNTIDYFAENSIAVIPGTDSADKVMDALLIKGNTCKNAGLAAIIINNYSTAKIKTVDIAGNTIYDWLRIESAGNSYDYCGIVLSKVNGAFINSNRIYSNRLVTAESFPARADPLRLIDCTNTKFVNNDCSGLVSLYSSVKIISYSGTNTGTIASDNIGLNGWSNISTDIGLVNALYMAMP